MREFTDEWLKETEKEIKRLMLSMNISHMPSRSEIKIFSGNTILSNRVMKSGGFYYWAEKLGIPVKNSDTETGRNYEIKCMKFLKSNGYDAEMTGVKFPYDILVNKATKIDVKISNGYDGNKGFFFAFNLESKLPKCDFFVMYCVNSKCNKTLIIPAHHLYGIGQASIGIESVYDKYIDRWDYIYNHVKLINDNF